MQRSATLTTWKALRVCWLLCILLVLSLTLTRELGSFSRLMISAFGSSVLLLSSEEASRLCLDLQSCIGILACQESNKHWNVQEPQGVQGKNSDRADGGQNALDVTSNLTGRRFLLSLRACLAGLGGLRPAKSSSSCSSGLTALKSKRPQSQHACNCTCRAHEQHLKGLPADGKSQHRRRKHRCWLRRLQQ